MNKIVTIAASQLAPRIQRIAQIPAPIAYIVKPDFFIDHILIAPKSVKSDSPMIMMKTAIKIPVPIAMIPSASAAAASTAIPPPACSVALSTSAPNRPIPHPNANIPISPKRLVSPLPMKVRIQSAETIPGLSPAAGAVLSNVSDIIIVLSYGTKLAK